MMDAANDGYAVTTMINPDGTVTVRRKIMNPDGSFTIKEEEHPSDDQEQAVEESPEVHLNNTSDSVSSITDMKTSIISVASSKEDVFAGIEDSPLRPQWQNRSTSDRNSRPKSSPPESNMHTPLPTSYQSAMPSPGAVNETSFIEQQRLQPNGTSGGISPPSPIYDWDFRQLRDGETLLETSSVVQLDTPVTVTVFKKNLNDRIGINVGLSRVEYKDRLIVTRISNNGLLSDSAIEEGDVIMSINSHSFLDDPHTDDALGKSNFEILQFT